VRDSLQSFWQDVSNSSVDRIAQLICEKIFYTDVREVKELDNKERYIKGFGSTGLN